MNVFEYLDLPKDHRTDKKIVQLVKNRAEANQKKLELPVVGGLKKDGVYAMAVFNGIQCRLFNRTGKKLTNVEFLEDKLSKWAWNENVENIVLIFELCNEEASLEELSGMVNPNRVNPLSGNQGLIMLNSRMYFHDYITLAEFKNGQSTQPYHVRYHMAKALVNCMYGLDEIGPYSSIIKCKLLETEEAVEAYASELIEDGEEGAVFKHPFEGWIAGRKNFVATKIVRGIHVDLECIGWEEGTGKYTGLVANLLFRYEKGKTVKAMLGKGWTHELAREMYLNIHYGFDVNMPEWIHTDHPIGKIYHVYGLQPSSKNGLIRLPKVAELRHDKATADY